ncbi:hypothetical protein [Bradyrhizobium sp. CW9]|uniref:hypothetical protein n=1 Tax=Bradyrhizobium sp. CW9 TaxID=2782689 RepID=UPI001FF851DB|nr:hypothetical protein [Bradyrhizobium sp. CW9]
MSDVETTWRLLDYIAIDYAGAVSQGQISSPSEFRRAERVRRDGRRKAEGAAAEARTAGAADRGRPASGGDRAEGRA